MYLDIATLTAVLIALVGSIVTMGLLLVSNIHLRQYNNSLIDHNKRMREARTRDNG